MCIGLQQRSLWPAGILTGLVLLAVLLVAAVIGVNPGIFKRELKSQFLLVCLLCAIPIKHQNRKLVLLAALSRHICITSSGAIMLSWVPNTLTGNMRIGKVKQAEMLSLLPPVQVGDWGREGTLNQTAVAALMAHVADSIKPDFILSMGDNFYESGSLLSR